MIKINYCVLIMFMRIQILNNIIVWIKNNIMIKSDIL